MAGLDVDYLFTDVSTFFLDEARQRFGEQARMRYGLFDLNADPWAQGMAPNSFDVVVCANVLHNGRHADEVLRRLCSLLRPGGWLLFIEATRDSYPLMASMEFKEGLTDFADERQATERTGAEVGLVPVDSIDSLEVVNGAGTLLGGGRRLRTAAGEGDRARGEEGSRGHGMSGD